MTFKKGDHIKCKCTDPRISWLGANHHGIYISETSVIHFEGATQVKAKITETSFEQFSLGKTVYKVEYPELPFTAEEIAARAIATI